MRSDPRVVDAIQSCRLVISSHITTADLCRSRMRRHLNCLAWTLENGPNSRRIGPLILSESASFLFAVVQVLKQQVGGPRTCHSLWMHLQEKQTGRFNGATQMNPKEQTLNETKRATAGSTGIVSFYFSTAKWMISSVPLAKGSSVPQRISNTDAYFTSQLPTYHSNISHACGRHVNQITCKNKTEFHHIATSEVSGHV